MPQNQVPANIVTAARGLNAARQTARQMGLPLTANDPSLRVSLPDSQNAAPLYLKIHALYSRNRSQNDISRFLKPTRTEADRQAAKQDLQRYAPVLQLAEQAASRPHCAFNRDWSAGPEMLFPEYSTMRAVVRLLAAQAVLQMEANDPINALKSLQKGIAIANHASEQPPTIPFLVSVAITLMINQTYQELFQRFGARPNLLPQWSTYQRKLNERTTLEKLKTSFRGESFFILSGLTEYRDGKTKNPFVPGEPPIPGISSNLTPAEQRIYADAWEARHWQFWNEIFAEFNRRGSALRSLHQKVSALSATHEAKMRTSPRDLSYLFTAIVTPVFRPIVRKAMQLEATNRLSVMALQVVKIKQTTGKYPASLPNALPDPFTDEPLLYRKDNQGYFIYSQSSNGRDDNGDPSIAKRGKGTPIESEGFPLDITFRLP